MQRPPIQHAARRIGVRLAVATLIVGGLVTGTLSPVGPTLPEAAAVPLPCAARDPLAGLQATFAARWPGRRFTAAVVADDGCTYVLNGGARMPTASVLKIEVMAAVLLRAQDAGRPLTAAERADIGPMIRESVNPPTTRLWTSLGGAAGMERWDARFGLADTTHAAPQWGLTTTSAVAQARFIRQVAGPDAGPLDASSRASARSFLTTVVPSQRWGASAAVPAGFTVSQKNGFVGSTCCRWILNTVGYVQRPGGSSGWGVAVLTNGWPTQAAGQAAVHEITAQINRVVLGTPIGRLDVAAVSSNRITVSGWAADRDRSDPVAVHVYVDGRIRGDGTADRHRPDVAAVHPHLGARRGYSVTVSAPEGSRLVCVYAINQGPGAPNPSLGCRGVTIAVSPRGSLDAVTPAFGGARVRGWAADPDSREPIRVHVYSGQAGTDIGPAALARPDVAQRIPGTGPRHGFDAVVALAHGTHRVCAYGINVGPGANRAVGCRSVAVDRSPIGHLDGITWTDDHLVATGWAADPDAAVTSVRVTVGGAVVAAGSADGPRPDVARAVPGVGTDRGFDLDLPAPTAAASAQVCVVAVNSGGGTDRPLGCRSVTRPTG